MNMPALPSSWAHRRTIRSFPRVLCPLLLCLNFLALPSSANQLLPLTASGTRAHTQWRILAQDQRSLRLEFTLPALELQEIPAAGEVWHTLALERGALLGAAGTPGLPAVGRLVAVPSGVGIRARILDFEVQEVPDLRLLPVQPAGATAFVHDPAAYAEPGYLRVKPARETTREVAGADPAAPTVLLGKPALLAGQAVVPLTIAPVAYAPLTRRAVVASRVVVELTFTADADEAGHRTPVSRRTGPPAAFTASGTDQILGRPDQRDGADGAGPGTWAVVCHDATVAARLAPLLAWRARQGYHVEVIVSTGTPASIKAQLQALYDDPDLPPLLFVMLAGDTQSAYGVATWHEQLSSYYGEGDHYYVTLDGDDILADAHVGRLSFSDLDMLDGIVAKILAYETAPPMDDTSWFREACVIGDPADSGITTIYVNQWLKGQFLANGYAAVDTIWGGNFVSQFLTSVNSGKSAFGYRGFWNMSGITPGHIASLGNGGRLPVAILPTCETGSFDAPYACHSEAFLRNRFGGAIAAVATATGGTHTRYNNCFYQGIWDGLLNAGDPRIGPAHTLGKLELYNNYYLAEPESAEIWAVWNNIMGDAASQIWQGVPRILNVDHPALVSVGCGAVAVAVTCEGAPVAGAQVCLYREGAVQIAGRTDAAGQILLATPPLEGGELQVTVWGPGLLPYAGGLTVGTMDVFCGLSDHLVDDDQNGASAGNGDGQLNPGETVELSLQVTNHGTTVAHGVTGELSAADWSVIQTAGVSFGEVAAGTSVWSSGPAVVQIDPSAPDGALIAWPVHVAAGGESWPSVLAARVQAAAMVAGDLGWSAGSTFEPGQSGDLTVTLSNLGSLDAGAVSATLSSDSPWLEIGTSAASFGTIPVGASGSNTAEPFVVAIDETCFPGHLAVLRLSVTYNDGMLTTTELPITVGTTATDDPTGPGPGGYVAFDDTDTEYFFAPEYDWVALDPDHGGPGLDLGLTDFGFEQDDTKTIDLPFTFRYYGVDFTEVSICSNGWLAMGETPLVHYRNWSIPSKGSPGSMIAPFWDNLYQFGTRKVYTHYDEAGHRFIVQWYNMANDFSNSIQNFEVILLDPSWHPTATGDGAIIFQYEQVHNTDSRDGYATVGLQNHDRSGGLLYSYWNQYAPGAAPLVAGRAIRFQPLGEIVMPVAQVEPAAFAEILEPGDLVEQTLHIANVGAEGSHLSYQITAVDPETIPDKAPEEPDKSIQGSTMTFDVTNYEPGTTVDIEVAVHSVSDNGLLSVAQLLMPSGVTLNSGEDLAYDGAPRLFWREQVGEGVLTTWDGLEGGYLYYVPDGMTVTATLNLTFGPDLVGELVFNYMLEDLGYWTPPDQVNGTIRLVNELPSVVVTSPEAGAVAVIGSDVTVAFEVHNTSDTVDLALQREPDGPWQTLATGIEAASGSWTWPVSGEPGPHAVIRVSDGEDDAVYGDSGVFAVGRNLDWLTIAPEAGQVDAGQAMDIALTLDAAELQPGAFAALLVIATSSGETITVPVDLLVRDPTGVGGVLPQQVALLGNHPNPFNPVTTVSFALPRDMPVTLDVFSARGLRVRRILEGRQSAGLHHVVWDGRDGAGRAVASGVYFMRLDTPDRTVTDKVLLAK